MQNKNRNRFVSSLAAVTASLVLLPSVATRAQQASPQKQESPIKCDPKTGELLGFTAIARAVPGSDMPDFVIKVEKDKDGYKVSKGTTSQKDMNKLNEHKQEVDQFVDMMGSVMEQVCRQQAQGSSSSPHGASRPRPATPAPGEVTL